LIEVTHVTETTQKKPQLFTEFLNAQIQIQEFIKI
jgi:hypothetical protein